MDSLSNILSDQKNDYLNAMNVSSLDDAFLAFDPLPTPSAVKQTIITQDINIIPSVYNSPEARIDLNKIDNLMAIFLELKMQVDKAIRILESEKCATNTVSPPPISFYSPKRMENDNQVLEGLFNGEKMIDHDGKEYSVPPNYASKSKLVEGDLMKLTIAANGSFIYKQVGPVARERIIGSLTKDAITNSWLAETGQKSYKILTASVTFYRGKSGDKVVFLIAKDFPCLWGAVDNIISI